MTGQERDYDEVLSRVLHSTTDHIEPVGDGLTKIQARLAEPWLKRQWWLLRSEFTSLGWVLAVRCQFWFNSMRSGSGAGAADTDAVAAGRASASAAGDGRRLRSLPVVGGMAARAEAKRPRHASSSLRFSVGPMMSWLRPALAVSGAVVLVVAGVFALGGVQRGLFGSYANSAGPGAASSGGGGGAGKPNGSGGQAVPGTVPTTQSTGALTGATNRPSSKAVIPPLSAPSSSASTPKATPAPMVTPTVTPSPTVTPTATPSPTVTPTVSPSPTDTPAAAPMSSNAG